MDKKLSRLTKIIYGSGDLGFSLTGTIIGAYFLFFLIDVVGIKPAVAGIAILIGKTWDYINDPLIGHLSDRTRTRWGRRRPFLLFGALPFGLAFILLWYRPPFESQIALAAYYACAFVLYDAAATFVYMPYFSLTPELTDDYDERTSLTSYRMFYSILGSLLAFTVPLMIVGTFNPENASRVLLMGTIFGLGSAIPLILVFFNTRERKDFAVLEKPKLLESLKAAFKNRPFVFGAVIYLLTWICMDILQTVLLFFVKHVLRLESMSDLIMALIFVTAMFALPNFNEILIHANGFRYPWDYLTAWWYSKQKIKSASVKSISVLPEFLGAGVVILLFAEMAKRLIAKGYEWSDFSLTSDDNPNTPVLAERIGAKIYKRYQTYRLTF